MQHFEEDPSKGTCQLNQPLENIPGTFLTKQQCDFLIAKYYIDEVSCCFVEGSYRFVAYGHPVVLNKVYKHALELIAANREQFNDGHRKTALPCVLVCRPRVGRLGPRMHGEVHPPCPHSKSSRGMYAYRSIAGYDVKLSFYPFGFDTMEL